MGAGVGGRVGVWSWQLEGLYVGDLLYPGSQFRIAGLEASEGPWLWLPTGLLLA